MQGSVIDFDKRMQLPASSYKGPDTRNTSPQLLTSYPRRILSEADIQKSHFFFYEVVRSDVVEIRPAI